jgi:hypothetical protein
MEGPHGRRNALFQARFDAIPRPRSDDPRKEGLNLRLVGTGNAEHRSEEGGRFKVARNLVNHVGPLPLAEVVPARLAGLRRVAKEGEEVVAHLKCIADGTRKLLDLRKIGSIRSTSQRRTEEQRTFDRVARGLQVTDARTEGGIALGEDVKCLPLHDFLLHFREHDGGGEARLGGEVDGEEGSLGDGNPEIAGQNRADRCVVLGSGVGAERCVAARTAAADVVLVHPIIVGEQITLQKLDRDERWRDLRCPTDAAGRLVGKCDKDRAEPLSAANGKRSKGIGDERPSADRNAERVTTLLEEGRQGDVHHRPDLLRVGSKREQCIGGRGRVAATSHFGRVHRIGRTVGVERGHVNDRSSYKFREESGAFKNY